MKAGKVMVLALAVASQVLGIPLRAYAVFPPVSVPEPSSLVLFAAGASALAWWLLKRR